MPFFASSFAKDVIYLKDEPDPKEQLFLEVILFLLAKSDYADQFTIEKIPASMSEARWVSMINDDEMSVMWAGIQPEYEEQLRPIRIPALKGLLGHRIFIIREGDQEKFDNVNSLDDLRKIPLGQGKFWGDTKILKHNNLLVIDPAKYSSLMYMLEGGRFDFFPRGVHEPWSEVEAFSDLNLTVEESILLIYPFGMYFYVKKGNELLAKAIESGFENAYEDGSYDQMLFSNPLVKDALTKRNLK